MNGRLRLGVNIDHVATVRNARGGRFPDPTRAAELAIAAGADGITAHLREDRRHIGDEDIARLSDLCHRTARPLNLEMAVTDEMVAIALHHRPHAACLVPERREERTTEGGLDVAGRTQVVGGAVAALSGAGIRASLFIEPTPAQIDAAAAIGAPVVELHTGAWCEAAKAGDSDRAADLLKRLADAAARADAAGMEVHAGHGIDFDTVDAISRVPQVRELNIGHFLIGEAIFVGLEAAIDGMCRRMDAARSEASA